MPSKAAHHVPQAPASKAKALLPAVKRYHSASGTLIKKFKAKSGAFVDNLLHSRPNAKEPTEEECS